MQSEGKKQSNSCGTDITNAIEKIMTEYGL